MHPLDMTPRAFTAQAKADQISPERERELVLDYRHTGSLKARDELLHGTRWVSAVAAHQLAKDYKVLHHFHDLYMEGQAATIDALETFDPAEETRFSAYAYTACDRGMKKYLRNMAGSVVREQKTVTVDGERTATKLVLRNDISLDMTNNDDSEDNGYAFLGDMSLNPERLSARRQLDQRLQAAFTCLSYRERVVVHDCLLGDKTLKELGEQMGGISHERVRQIGARGIKKLREAIDNPAPARRRAQAPLASLQS